MQAITTKYIGPSNTKGARIKATCDAGSTTIPYPHELSGSDVHAQAAMALCRKLGWTPERGHMGNWVCGGLESNYVFVFNSNILYVPGFPEVKV
jgi:hypothetical protein